MFARFIEGGRAQLAIGTAAGQEMARLAEFRHALGVTFGAGGDADVVRRNLNRIVPSPVTKLRVEFLKVGRIGPQVGGPAGPLPRGDHKSDQNQQRSADQIHP